MIDRGAIQIFDSFEDADEADRRERWAMTPGERLIALELLRSYHYPSGEIPRLERIFESVIQS